MCNHVQINCNIDGRNIVKDHLQQHNIELRLVPPNQHCANVAEKAFFLFKDHFISGLVTVHPSFPIHLWCWLVPMAVTTLNLLCPLQINPQLPVYKILNRVFDYNKMPLAPLGTKVVVHKPPNKRGTWSPHSQHGWYLGMAPGHYHCHQVYVPKTRTERIAQTVTFLHPTAATYQKQQRPT